MMSLFLSALAAGPVAHAAPSDRAAVVLFESVEDWRAGRPAHDLKLPVHPVEDVARIRASEGTLEFAALDIDRPVARAVGHVAVVQQGDQLFYNESAPRPFGSRAYGPLQVIGDQAVYAREACIWTGTGGTSGGLVCWNEVRSIDLDTLEHGTITRRSLRRTLRQYPDLLQEWRNEGAKNASARWRTTEALLLRSEGLEPCDDAGEDCAG